MKTVHTKDKLFLNIEKIYKAAYREQNYSLALKALELMAKVGQGHKEKANKVSLESLELEDIEVLLQEIESAEEGSPAANHA